MKFKHLIAIAGFAMAICACDEGTDNIGMSLTSNNDNVNVTTEEFNVLTASYIPDSVYTYNNELYLGRVTDPETNTTVACSFTLQFNMMEETHLGSEDRITSRDENGEIVADSCVIYLFFDQSKSYGDSTTAMKLRISELDHPIPDGIHYTSFDPVKEGFIRQGGLSKSHMYTFDDMTANDSAKKESDYIPYVAIRLNQPYTDKNGVRYNNYGTYILRNYYQHPEYFKNSFAFIHQMCPGFYIESTDGQGMMSYFVSAQFSVYYTYLGYDQSEEDGGFEEFASYLLASSTNEVLQTITVKNDKEKLKQLVESDNSCTFMKTPAAIFTEVTLPVDDIKSSHMNDSLLSVSLDFNRINNYEPLSKYTFSAPPRVLLIQKDSLTSFFEKNQNYNNKYAFYTSLYKNGYSFSNSSDINNLIIKMYNDRLEGLKSDPNWVEKHPNWNKALLLPVGILTSTTSSTDKTPIALVNEMGLTTTRLKRGTPEDPIKLRVLYARFNH